MLKASTSTSISHMIIYSVIYSVIITYLKNKHCELIYIIPEELTTQWQLIVLFYEENCKKPLTHCNVVSSSAVVPSSVVVPSSAVVPSSVV